MGMSGVPRYKKELEGWDFGIEYKKSVESFGK
jgi:hypothetical protein